jgi:hypothetical protein
MKKQEMKMSDQAPKQQAANDNTSRVLLIAAVLLYSVSLILLANLAIADVTTKMGALIKVNNQLDGNAFADLEANVKTVSGNVLAVDVPRKSLAHMPKVKGVCASHLDNERTEAVMLDGKSEQQKYAGTGVVVGILDNMGTLSPESMLQLKKIEEASNVGFISYVNDKPGSTVIMRNLKGGESNLIQALLYMEEYAKTVERPLIIEMNIGEEEMNNPLFVQVCQKFADAGVQFLGSALSTGALSIANPLQMAFSMYNVETGQIIDQSDFWAIEEVKDEKIMMMGSDEKTCIVHFINEAGFDKVFMSNSSSDIVMVTTLSAEGNVNYYHVENNETALIPRELMNGTPMLEDGLGGIYPHHSKGVLFNGAIADKQFVAISSGKNQIELNAKSGMAMNVASPNANTLAMSLDKLSADLNIEIKDETGATVYRNQPDEETQSITTRINLSSGVGGLYFLDLTSPEFHQTFALLID